MRMRLLVLVALLGLVLPALPAGAQANQVRLDGVTVELRHGTRQVVTVNHTRGYRARVSLWVDAGGRWIRTAQSSAGRIGYGGLVRGDLRRQGSGTTPLGTFTLPYSFGMHDRRPAWDLRHRRITKGDYWVQDNASRFYNRYRNKRQGGFRWRLPASDANSSERLLDYRREYEFAVVIGFNPGQVRHRGAGIFLHVNGSGATAGCVSVPRRFMTTLLRRLDPDHEPLIAVGR